jgi:ABC-type transporter MlaC component
MRKIRRTMRIRFGILLMVAFVSMLCAAACGGVEEQVQEQVDQEVQGVQEQAEEALQGERTQIEEQIQEGQTQVEEALEEAIDGQ